MKSSSLPNKRRIPALLAVFLPTFLHAAITLPQIFSPGAVLQRDVPIPVWGDAAPAENIMVQLLRGTSVIAAATTTADSVTGRWKLVLPPQPAAPASAARILAVMGSATPAPVRIPDILIGEVWFASGQSNMEWIVKETDGASAEIARSANPDIRIMRIQRTIADGPASDITGKWLTASPSTTGWMTAVGYYFSKKLSADLGGIPVGVINASRGSARIQPWLPGSVFERASFLASDRASWQRALAGYPQAKAHYDLQLAAWQTESEAARQAGKSLPRRPEAPFGPGHYNQPSGLFNGMVAPLTPYAIRGILWYQGEANARQAVQYREALSALISSWRDEWKEPQLPFLVVQLAAYRNERIGFLPSGLERAALREAQSLAVQQNAKTGLVVTLDVSGPKSEEHPRNKRPVGERLARLAQTVAYNGPPPDGLPVVGPTLASVRFDGSVARVIYQPGSAERLQTTDAKAPTAFEIAGEDRCFHPAVARIENLLEISLSSPAVPAPVAVRYAFCNDPQVNLVNAAKLPAAPFRTDIWPLDSGRAP